MPTIVNPIGLYLRYISSSAGNSWRQGPHQLAQKLIITTWPRRPDSDSCPPARLASVNSGAGGEPSVALAGHASATNAASRAATGNLRIGLKCPPQKNAVSDSVAS